MTSYKFIYVWLFFSWCYIVRTIYAASCINNSFILITDNILLREYNRIYFTHLTTDEYLGGFKFWTI